MKKVVISLVLISIFSSGYFALIDYMSTKKINLVNVYVASRTIKPREIIKESDIKEVSIPYKYVSDNAINTKENIVGKITSIQGMIVEGSLFYKEQLDKLSEIPDSAVPLLNEKEVAFMLDNEKGKLNIGSFSVGQHVDIYVSINRRNENPIFDLLLTSIRIVSIKDRKGIEINDKESVGTPYSLTFAIDQEAIRYLSLANKIGEIEIYASNTSYKNNQHTINKESKVFPFLIDE